MARTFFTVMLVLSFFPLTYCEPASKSTKPPIYNEQALTKELKGKTKEEVLKVLGNPAVKKHLRRM